MEELRRLPRALSALYIRVIKIQSHIYTNHEPTATYTYELSTGQRRKYTRPTPTAPRIRWKRSVACPARFESLTTRTFDHPLFSIAYPYIAHCMRACRAKGEWSLFSLSLSPPPLSLSRLSTPCSPKHIERPEDPVEEVRRLPCWEGGVDIPKSKPQSPDATRFGAGI